MFYVIYLLALEGPSLKYAENILLIFTLCYNARPSCLIRSIRTICKYRNCSFLTGLITLLTDLSQAYHLGRIGTSNTSLQAPLSFPDRFAHSSVLRSPNLFPPCLGQILFVGYMYIHWFLWCSVIGGILDHWSWSRSWSVILIVFGIFEFLNLINKQTKHSLGTLFPGMLNRWKLIIDKININPYNRYW